MKSLFDTLNIVYGEDEKRGFVKLNAISLLFTVGGILFVVAALGAIVVIPVAFKYIGFPRRLICSCVSADGRRCSWS
jgi:membrane protein